MRKIILAAGLNVADFATIEGAPTAAKKVEPAREAVTERGRELLALIDEAGDEGVMLTQDEGLDIVSAGFAVVDTSVVEGDTAKVTLTDAGRAQLSGYATPTSSYEIDEDIPLPTGAGKRRGRTGGYPFEILGIGQSFHVAPKDGETPEAVAARMQSSVSGARTRFAEPTGDMETVKTKVYAKDAEDNFIKDEAGKRVIASETEVTRPKTKVTRDFTVKAVDASDPKGVGARIWRIA